MFFKNGILKIFLNIHRKTPVLKSLFNKVAGILACNFIKKKLQQRCFPVNIAKFVGTVFFVEKPLVAALDIYFHEYVIVPKTV